MIVAYVYGVYRFARKQIGYRNDYCLGCKKEVIAQRWRSFNCGHFFWIPIIPFGFFKWWQCPFCQIDPHARTQSSQGFKIFAAVMFVLFTILALIGAIASMKEKPTLEHPDTGVGFFWGATVICGLISAALIWWTTIRQEPEDLEGLLRQVKPARLDVCPYCSQKLTSEAFCEACQLQRYDVNDLRR
ncbi:MAG: hypothetical protein NTX57_12730 [Armatimonadetes bacterium]|nr:hypothetical protein [Armatimonadota bacterium]